MLIAQYFVEFIFYSFLGWVWESIYCTAKEKHWADRGFLFGPVCPIYGSSVIAASLVFERIQIGGLSAASPWWLIFIICYAGSAVAEFSTSWVLERRFHMRWWDYSRMPLNIQGRICVPVSIAFGVAGIAVVKVILPFAASLHNVCPETVYVILSLILAMVFGADYALTEASMSALLKDIERMHKEFNESQEARYQRLAAAPGVLREKIHEAPGAIAEKLQEAPGAIAETIREVRSQEALRDNSPSRFEEAARHIAEHRAGRLSFNQQRILGSVRTFLPKTADLKLDDRFENDHPGEYLKASLARKKNEAKERKAKARQAKAEKK